MARLPGSLAGAGTSPRRRRADLLLVAVGQRALELLTRVEQAAHDRALRDAHRLRHLLVAQAVDLAHHDDRPVVARQRVERGLEARGNLAAPDDVDGVGAVDPAEEGKVDVGAVVGVEAGLFEVGRLPPGLRMRSMLRFVMMR